MIRKKLVTLFSVALSVISIQGIAQQEETALLPVFQIVLDHNPNIQIALSSIMSSEGNLIQESLRPNPKALIELENFGGDGSLSGFDGAEITFGIEQEIEILGKRSYRRDVARYGLAVAQQKAIMSIMAVLASAHQSYVGFIIAQERLNLAQKRLELSNETHEVVKSRVSAAATSEIQHTKVDIEQKIAFIQKSKAKEKLASARAQLEKILSTTSDKITSDNNILSTSLYLPTKKELIDAIDHLPQTEVMRLKELQAKSSVELAKAHRIPNPTVGFGARRLRETNSNAFIATFSIPIPVFDSNQGNLAQAQAEYSKASSELREASLSLKETAESIYEQLVSSSSEVISYRESIIPSAQKAYSQAAEGYNSGRFSFLELLDAQRTLYEIQEANLESLLKYHQTKAQADFLLSVNIDLVKNIIYLNNGDQK